MAALKCIGGTNDGEYYEVENAIRVGDTIQIHQRVAVPVLAELNPLPEKVAMKSSLYSIRIISSDSDKIFYLALVKWTDKQAIEFQFAK